MGSSVGIHLLAHLEFSRSRQCLAFPIFGCQERRRFVVFRRGHVRDRVDMSVQVLFSFRTSFFTFSSALPSTISSWRSVNSLVVAQPRPSFSPRDGKVMSCRIGRHVLRPSACRLAGVGFAMIINSVLCMLYYNVIISWALFYFIASFRKNLLWTECGNWWNDAKCFVPGAGNAPYKINGTIFNCTAAQYNQSVSTCTSIKSSDVATATEQFF
jgi:hypothetical protein